MLICLPALAFIFLVIFYRRKVVPAGWRGAWVLAAVTLAAAAVVFIEVASLFSAVTALSVRFFWMTACCLAAGLCWRTEKQKPLVVEVSALGLGEKAALVGIFLLVGINALVAFAFPPNNWDSMTYHLPRVMHWAVNGSVHFYPTAVDRQLFNQPGAEFLLLHIFLLTGNDHWFNFLQWTSWVGCALSASWIAGWLGARLRGQILTALFAVSVPMAVLQSTSTQNDLVVSFWIMSFVVSGLMLFRRFTRTSFLAGAAALGLGLLTKGTCLVVLPFLVWFLCAGARKVRAYFFVGCLVMLVLAAGHYVRSWAWQDGKRMISPGQSGLLLRRHDPAAIAVNAAAHIASESLMPWAPANTLIEKAVHRLEVLGGSTSLSGAAFSSVPYLNLVFDEDYAPAPLHMVLVLLVFFLLCRGRPVRGIRSYVLCVLLGFLLLAAIIQWQPFAPRFHLPLFMVFAPLAGFMLADRRPWLISGLLLMTAGLTVMAHNMRPFANLNSVMGDSGRSAAYFAKWRPYIPVYARAARIILDSGCREVGLLLAKDSWEYPLWALTGLGTVRFRPLALEQDRTAAFCMIVTIDKPQAPVLVTGGVTYDLVWQDPPLQLFAQAGSGLIFKLDEK